MKMPMLKIVDPDNVEPMRELQLSLFDWHQPCSIVCVSLEDMHGVDFLRIIDEMHPSFFVDFRMFPYFDLTSLDRASAFAAMRDSGARYLHVSIELNEPHTQEQRWTLRRLLLERFAWLRSALELRSGSGVGFVGTRAELQLLKQYARQIPGWIVEDLEPKTIP